LQKNVADSKKSPVSQFETFWSPYDLIFDSVQVIPLRKNPVRRTVVMAVLGSINPLDATIFFAGKTLVKTNNWPLL